MNTMNNTANASAAEDVLLLVHARNNFYKKKYRLAIVLYSLCLIVIISLLTVLGYLIKHPAQPFYFLTDSAGRLIEDPIVTEPNMKLEEVENWTIHAVEAAYSYHFMDYRQQLQDAQQYFTPYGWRNYMQSLTASNNLLALTQRKMIFVAKAIGKPLLLNQGLLGGAYAWKFQVPLLVNFFEAPYDKPAFSNAYTLSVIVERKSLLENSQGLAIVQMIAGAPR